MKANPGGNLDPDKVYGRDQLIALLWNRLENQSILMNAERRIGKTQILRKMLLEPQTGWKPIYRNVEKVHSANDMYPVTVTPLAPPDAERLAADLLTGENITCDDLTGAAATIAEEVDYFPFYVHHVVAGLRVEQLSAAESNTRDFVARQLVDASDPWQLAHYRTRLSGYYPDSDDARNAAIILDVLALTDDPADSLSVDETFEQTRVRGATVNDRDDLLRLLRLMDADHYLSRDTDGGYRFRFPLIRRWWKLDRGL